MEAQRKKNQIYLFVHIPKTGGAMFNRNIENSLPRSNYIRLNFNYQDYYYDLITKQLRFYEGGKDFYNMIDSLSLTKKESIRVIGGHDLEFGIHQLFPQPAKYFVFFREPISRTISLYNHHRGQHALLKKNRKLDEGQAKLLSAMEKLFLIEGQVPSFEEWLDKKYNTVIPLYFSMSRFLSHLKFLDPDIGPDSYNRLFEKFFFVGLTETIDEDTLYLSQEIGINRFWSDKNNSKSFVLYSKLEKRVQEMLQEKNRKDLELYLEAKKRNIAFKKGHPNFHSIVKRARIKKISTFPLEKSMNAVKSILRPLLLPLRNRIRQWIVS